MSINHVRAADGQSTEHSARSCSDLPHVLSNALIGLVLRAAMASCMAICSALAFWPTQVRCTVQGEQLMISGQHCLQGPE